MIISALPGRGRFESRRCGSAYIFTAMATLSVAVVGLGMLLLSGVQRDKAELEADLYRASLYAQAGLRMACHRIDHDADWRTHAEDGDWESDQVIGTGSYSFEVTDLKDGDVANSDYDPVEVIATGKSGRARHKLRLALAVRVPGLDCLKSSIHADGDVIFDGVTVTSDHWVTSHGSIKAEAQDGVPSQVYADVASASSVTAKDGSQYHGIQTTEGDWPLSMPDPATVMDYYLANGTVIDINDIPLWGANLLDNPSMEESPAADGWAAYGDCSISGANWYVDDGSKALEAWNRATPSAGPSQDITAKLANGLTYHVVVRVLLVNETGFNGRLTIDYESTGDGAQTWSSPWVELEQGKYKTLESSDKPAEADSFTPTWSGTLTSAVLRVETETTLDDIFIDATSLTEITAYPFIRAIHRQVLGPDHNPFGGGATNSEGIYVIDCQGNLLSIQRSRISGTLVILNPHSEGVFVWSVVQWSPAVSNYPAVLCDGKLSFWLANELETELEEASANVNYNPPGMPYQGHADADKSDVYGALMRGIIYSTADVKLRYNPVLEGVVVADGQIVSQATKLLGMTYFDVTYLSHFYEDPPPGFRATPVFSLAPGSLRRVVD